MCMFFFPVIKEKLKWRCGVPVEFTAPIVASQVAMGSNSGGGTCQQRVDFFFLIACFTMATTTADSERTRCLAPKTARLAYNTPAPSRLVQTRRGNARARQTAPPCPVCNAARASVLVCAVYFRDKKVGRRLWRARNVSPATLKRNTLLISLTNSARIAW